jgi:hypothetical protein
VCISWTNKEGHKISSHRSCHSTLIAQVEKKDMCTRIQYSARSSEHRPQLVKFMCLLHRILSNRSLAIIVVVVEFNFGLINSIEQHPSLESERPAASQEIPYILSNLKTYYNVHINNNNNNIIIIIIIIIREQHSRKPRSQRTTENSHTGHCTHTSERANIKAQKSQRRNWRYRHHKQ